MPKPPAPSSPGLGGTDEPSNIPTCSEHRPNQLSPGSTNIENELRIPANNGRQEFRALSPVAHHGPVSGYAHNRIATAARLGRAQSLQGDRAGAEAFKNLRTFFLSAAVPARCISHVVGLARRNKRHAS